MRAAEVKATASAVSPPARRVVATPSVMAIASLWAALAFVLNLIWEIAQVRLYTIWGAADGPSVAWALLHCSLGDVVIALAMFALAGVALRRVDWPALRPWIGGAIVVIGAVAFTVWSEWYNVYRVGNWSYTSTMPMIFGIGLSPLLQWIVLPPAIVGAYRFLAPVLFGQHEPQAPIPAHDLSKGPP